MTTVCIFNVETNPRTIMEGKIQRWGNSLAIRIPKPIAEQVGLKQGGVVDLEVEADALSIRPVAPPKYALADLVEGITEENRHQEIETGAALGEEAW
jgi:antitoxin MazE